MKIFDIDTKQYQWNEREFRMQKTSPVAEMIQTYRMDRGSDYVLENFQALLMDLRLWVAGERTGVTMSRLGPDSCELVIKTVDAVVATMFSGSDKQTRNITMFRQITGLDSGKPMQQKQVAKLHNVSGALVGTNYHKSLRILKHPSRSGELRKFTDAMVIDAEHQASVTLSEFPWSQVFLRTQGLDLFTDLEKPLKEKLRTNRMCTAWDLLSDNNGVPEWISCGFEPDEIKKIVRAIDEYDPRMRIDHALRNDWHAQVEAYQAKRAKILNLPLRQFNLTSRAVESITKSVFGGRYDVTVRDLILQPESAYLSASVRGIGPGWIKKVNDILAPDGLHIGMSEEELTY